MTECKSSLAVDVRQVPGGGGEQLELVVGRQTVVRWRLLLLAADSRSIRAPAVAEGRRVADLLRAGGRHRSGSADHPDDADPDQRAEEFEELEDGHERKADVEAEHAAQVAEHREQLSTTTNITNKLQAKITLSHVSK